MGFSCIACDSGECIEHGSVFERRAAEAAKPAPLQLRPSIKAAETRGWKFRFQNRLLQRRPKGVAKI